MDRRTFATMTAMAMASTLSAQPRGQTSSLPATGVRFSVMLWALADHASFDRSLQIVADAGYSGVELTGEFHHWSAEETARILARLHALGLTIDAMSGVRAGFAVPADTASFQTEFAEHLRFAQHLGCPQVILLSGKRIAGLAPDAQRSAAIQNLRWAGDQAAKANIEIVIEPIDLLEDPSIYLASVTDAFDLVRAVGLPHVKVLFDLYHEQRSFGNLLEKLERNLDLVGLIHVADVPGRHEPGTGEIAYGNIYRKLGQLHYDRWIAMEFYPTGDPVASLRQARQAAETALAGR